MKGWYAKHNDKWHRIRDVEDTGKPAHEEGGGNVYHLEGLDEPVHQSKLQDMAEKPDDVDKYDRVDVECDGKREMDYGSEELNKDPDDPDVKKSVTFDDLMTRWSELKKKAAAVDSDESILDISSQEYQDEDEGAGGEEQGDAGQADGVQQEAVEGDEEASEDEEEAEQGGEEAEPDAGDELDLEAQDQEGDEAQEGEEDQEGDEDEQEAEQKIAQALADEGYSEAEVAHILHGHTVPQATTDDIKVDAEQAKAQQEQEHKSRMNDLEYEGAKKDQKTNELDVSHKERMLDLEYQQAQKEKELELEHKKKKLELELEQMKDKHQKQMQAKKVESSGKSSSADASKTSEKEKKGK